MPLEIIRSDITKMYVDAIVNAANGMLRQGGGVCGAIFAAAGADRLQEECDRIGRCGVGEAVVTGGCNLPAKYIIHTVGPVWRGGGRGEEALLRSCYIRSLELAKERGLESVAFPLISSGIFGYPRDQAFSVAVSAIGSFVLENDMRVCLVIFGAESYRPNEALYRAVSAYLDDYDVRFREPPAAAGAPAADADERFAERLLRLAGEQNLSEPRVYRRANVDRRLFFRIRSDPNYCPGKNTALAFAVALRLNSGQTADLLACAGYALSPAGRFDRIVEYFIRQEKYNIFEINETLFAFNENLLGG